jgi:uncharacterized protein YndB with AHSA1/START domain
MTKKKKYTVELAFKSSPSILYNYLSNPSGLSEWFCDDVNIYDKKEFTFKWGNSEQKAEMIKNSPNKYIRFRWEDGHEDEYFEFEIIQDEITGDVGLVITDFALENEIEESKQLWETQVQTLKTAIGS